jgi:hypothetical protein
MSTPPRKSRNHPSPEATYVEAKWKGRRSLRDVLAQIDGQHGTTSAAACRPCQPQKRRTQVELEPPLLAAMKGFVSTRRASQTRCLFSSR